MRFPTKIPTLVGLVLVILLVGSIVVGSERWLRGRTRASESEIPRSVEVTNVTDTTFTIMWETAKPTTGALSVIGPDGKSRFVVDERDTENKLLGKYLTHMATARSLAPSTNYRIRILSNGKAASSDSLPSFVSTAPQLPPPTTAYEPAYGTVYTQTNQPADGALIFLTLEGGQKLSTLVKPSGSWMIPLNLTRTEDLSQFLAVKNRIRETITVTQNGEVASAITDTLNDAPVPAIILGKTYDFQKLQAKTDAATSPLALAESVLGEQATVPEPTTPSTTFRVQLVAPAEGASLTSTQPLIQGTGFPGKTVAITIGITQPVSGTTTVPGDGLWRFSPPMSLAPGKQSVTITTVDGNDTPVALTHTFEILKSGTQVLGSATPSATLTPTISTPTLALSPTPTATLAGVPVPVSGSTTPTLLLLVLAALLLVSGTVIFAF